MDNAPLCLLGGFRRRTAAPRSAASDRGPPRCFDDQLRVSHAVLQLAAKRNPIAEQAKPAQVAESRVCSAVAVIRRSCDAGSNLVAGKYRLLIPIAGGERRACLAVSASCRPAPAHRAPLQAPALRRACTRCLDVAAA